MTAALVTGRGLVPRPFVVRRRVRESRDTVTLTLEPLHGQVPVHEPGQFNMLYAFGIGEVPISMSGAAQADRLVHTVRAVGTVSNALAGRRRGEVIGVRGPFGTGWGCADAEGQDLVVMAGGLGLAPLRPVIRHAMAHRQRYRRIVVLIGARSPDELLFRRELQELALRSDVSLSIIVDHPKPGWEGPVGVVTTLVDPRLFDPSATVAMVCGPEPMMRFSALALRDAGVPAERIRISLERNMKCGLGSCGHCQLGPLFVCADGPVVTWERAAGLLGVAER